MKNTVNIKRVNDQWCVEISDDINNITYTVDNDNLKFSPGSLEYIKMVLGFYDEDSYTMLPPFGGFIVAFLLGTIFWLLMIILTILLV